MTFARTTTLLLPVMSILACSSSKNETAATASALSVTYTMASTVPAGGETHKCQFVKAPTDGTYIVRGAHKYTPGSHHLLLFRTDLLEIPAGMDAVGDCYETASGGYMSHVRGIVYGSQVPEGEQKYPAGVGLPLVSGEVYLMQTHYLNATSKALDARADLTLTLSDGDDVTTRAGILFYYDPFIHVPMGMHGAKAATRCVVPNDITLIAAQPHYHKRGSAFASFLDDASGALEKTPFLTSTDWDHPTSLAAPLTVKAGSRIRFECTYDNVGGTKDYYQGISAEDEMCVFIGTYYPAMTLPDEFCAKGRDMIGTGTANCKTTLDCFRACPGGTSGLAKITPQSASVDPCLQRCFVDSCPVATTKLGTLNSCSAQMCATECADPTTQACVDCATAKCADATRACNDDTCAMP